MELDFHKDPQILSTVIDALEAGVFTVDAQGHFVAWSEGVERITGYSAKDVVGQPCRILEGPNCKGFSTLAELLAAPTAAADCICNQECKLLTKDGRELHIYGSVRLLHAPEGRLLGAVGSFTDLTSHILANEKIALLEEQTRSRTALASLVGKSEPMREVFRRLGLAAQSDVTVMLTGESGTGKELAAAAIHVLSPRKAKPFLAINCSAIPETLLESELFGHVKGAFTGATRDKMGVFQAAEGGTLFLDEIGDVSPLMQVKLLRVLQSREVRRVGDERAANIDVRLITATNKDVKQLMLAGQMREDFYYRIRVFEITLPPLRQRREDIPLLVRHFLEELAGRQGKAVSGLSRDALAALMRHRWPGNVRELKNAIEAGLVTVAGDRLNLLDLPREVRNGDAASALGANLELPSAAASAEDENLLRALAETGGNRTLAAKRLGISRVTLWKRLRKLGDGRVPN